MLLADEPTTALDVTVQAQIMSLLKELREERDMAVVLITHDLALVVEQADRVVVMYAGNVVEQGLVEEVFGAPSTPTPRPAGVGARARRARRGAKSIGGAAARAGRDPGRLRLPGRCPIARDRCREERPAAREVAPGHLSACHFPDEVNR